MLVPAALRNAPGIVYWSRQDPKSGRTVEPWGSSAMMEHVYMMPLEL